MQNRNYAVELVNVTTRYPRSRDPALIDVSFKAPKESIVLITGPNGAGKTTLLQVILGFLKPLKGRIRVLGYDVPKHARLVRKSIGYLKQDFMKPKTETFRVREVVAMGLAPYKGLFQSISEEDEKAILDALRMVGAEDLLEKPFGILSGGQQQRVMLARVIVRKPKLILLDEPFSSIDKEGRAELARLIHSLRKKLGATAVIVSHDAKPLERYADLVVELRNGRIARVEMH